MKEIKYSVYAQSDKGLVRPVNEDAFYIDETEGVFAVADGLGGLPHGEVASKTAVETLKSYIKTSPSDRFIDFRESFDHAAYAVNSTKEAKGNEFGIATTLTAVRLFGKRAYIGHVGDSGILLFKKKDFTKLTKDHTMAQEIKDNSPMHTIDILEIPELYKNSLTQFIGETPSLDIQALQHELEPGDRVLLYTDGVTDRISFDELQEMAFKRRTPKTFVQDIIKTANKRGGKDNITAIALFVKQ